MKDNAGLVKALKDEAEKYRAEAQRVEAELSKYDGVDPDEFHHLKTEVERLQNEAEVAELLIGMQK